MEDSANALIEYLKGKVFAVVGIKAESEKAKEMAYNECLLAVDCMRICSPIMGFPKMKSDFDLERNSSVVLQTDSILQPCENVNEFMMTKSRNATVYSFDEFEFKNMKAMQLGLYHQFLIQSTRTSEIEKLILKSIRLFSEALKDKNLQSRTSKLFTIFESLILQNNEQGILNSIVRYAPKLIFDSIEDRDEMSKILKELYKVRSAYVHHAKLIEVNNEHLKRLQIGLSMLLSNLILLCKKYKTKGSIIIKIDSEINRSFRLWEEVGRKKQERENKM